MWGLYTPKSTDAAAITTELGGALPISHMGKSGEFNHYHVNEYTLFGTYRHFHIWYGLPNP